MIVDAGNRLVWAGPAGMTSSPSATPACHQHHQGCGAPSLHRWHQNQHTTQHAPTMLAQRQPNQHQQGPEWNPSPNSAGGRPVWIDAPKRRWRRTHTTSPPAQPGVGDWHRHGGHQPPLHAAHVTHQRQAPHTHNTTTSVPPGVLSKVCGAGGEPVAACTGRLPVISGLRKPATRPPSTPPRHARRLPEEPGHSKGVTRQSRPHPPMPTTHNVPRCLHQQQRHSTAHGFPVPVMVLAAGQCGRRHSPLEPVVDIPQRLPLAPPGRGRPMQAAPTSCHPLPGLHDGGM